MVPLSVLFLGQRVSFPGIPSALPRIAVSIIASNVCALSSRTEVITLKIAAKLCVATLEGSDRSYVPNIGSAEHRSVILLVTQVVAYNLSLILNFVVVAISVLWP